MIEKNCFFVFASDDLLACPYLTITDILVLNFASTIVLAVFGFFCYFLYALIRAIKARVPN